MSLENFVTRFVTAFTGLDWMARVHTYYSWSSIERQWIPMPQLFASRIGCIVYNVCQDVGQACIKDLVAPLFHTFSCGYCPSSVSLISCGNTVFLAYSSVASLLFVIVAVCVLL